MNVEVIGFPALEFLVMFLSLVVLRYDPSLIVVGKGTGSIKGDESLLGGLCV